VFRAEDADILAKARALLDRADRMMRTASPATDGRPDAATPSSQRKTRELPPPPVDPSRPVTSANPTTPPSSSAAVAVVSGFDGVYVGRSKSKGGAVSSDIYTWIVSGGRMEVRNDQGTIANGTVRPNGEFTFGNAETTAGGRIVGDTLTGTYERRNEGRIDDAGSFEAHRDTTGRSPGTTPKAAEPQRHFDGVYRGRAVYRGKETSHLVFEVTGSRIVLSMADDPQKRMFEGTMKPTGEFVVEFPNNTYRGRITNGSLEGTWTLHRGVLGDAGASGTFRASR
jgi:hypothetical protein